MPLPLSKMYVDLRIIKKTVFLLEKIMEKSMVQEFEFAKRKK